MESKHTVHACCGDRQQVGLPMHSEMAGCCGVSRRFMTTTERAKALQAYRTELTKELAGLEERLAELKA